MRCLSWIALCCLLGAVTAQCPSGSIRVNNHDVNLNDIGSVVFTQYENYDGELSTYQWGLSLCTSAPWLVSGAPAGECTSPNGYFQMFSPAPANPPNTCQGMYDVMNGAPIVNPETVVFNYNMSSANGWTASVVVQCMPGAFTLASMGDVVITLNPDYSYSLAATVGIDSFCHGETTTAATTGITTQAPSTTAAPTPSNPIRIFNCEGHDCTGNCTSQSYEQGQCFLPVGGSGAVSATAVCESNSLNYTSYTGTTCSGTSTQYSMPANQCVNYVAPDGMLWSYLNLC